MLPPQQHIIVQHTSPFPAHHMNSKNNHVVHQVHRNDHSGNHYHHHHYDYHHDYYTQEYGHSLKQNGASLTSWEYRITLPLLAIGIGCFVTSFFVKILWLLIIGIVLTTVTILYMICRTNPTFDGCFCICCFDLSDCGDICGGF